MTGLQKLVHTEAYDTAISCEQSHWGEVRWLLSKGWTTRMHLLRASEYCLSPKEIKPRHVTTWVHLGKEIVKDSIFLRFFPTLYSTLAKLLRTNRAQVATFQSEVWQEMTVTIKELIVLDLFFAVTFQMTKLFENYNVIIIAWCLYTLKIIDLMLGSCVLWNNPSNNAKTVERSIWVRVVVFPKNFFSLLETFLGSEDLVNMEDFSVSFSITSVSASDINSSVKYVHVQNCSSIVCLILLIIYPMCPHYL